ncbi:hypothetical protein PoB_003300400 [Plakobranchus ocellatus]|uniref:G protein-coupled receptor n=1 Tax=Plakobranchus ocellatus TaxID=259542 RepID=A0AAV4AFP8_9GAST|nr:hypothetical protein PoB_003300400 [Plakobranchus ocellatus]
MQVVFISLMTAVTRVLREMMFVIVEYHDTIHVNFCPLYCSVLAALAQFSYICNATVNFFCFRYVWIKIPGLLPKKIRLLEIDGDENQLTIHFFPVAEIAGKRIFLAQAPRAALPILILLVPLGMERRKSLQRSLLFSPSAVPDDHPGEPLKQYRWIGGIFL